MSLGEYVIMSVALYFWLLIKDCLGPYIYEPVIDFLFDKFHIIISYILSMLYTILYFIWIPLIWVILDYLL